MAGRSSASLAYTPVATGDFNGDGKADIVWHNSHTGATVIWLMNRTTYSSGVVVGGVKAPPTSWVPVGTGDFDGDGMTDILWHNNATGRTVVWFMNGTNFDAGK